MNKDQIVTEFRALITCYRWLETVYQIPGGDFRIIDKALDGLSETLANEEYRLLDLLAQQGFDDATQEDSVYQNEFVGNPDMMEEWLRVELERMGA